MNTPYEDLGCAVGELYFLPEVDASIVDVVAGRLELENWIIRDRLDSGQSASRAIKDLQACPVREGGDLEPHCRGLRCTDCLLYAQVRAGLIKDFNGEPQRTVVEISYPYEEMV